MARTVDNTKLPKRIRKTSHQKWVRSFLAVDGKKLHLIIDLLASGAEIRKRPRQLPVLVGLDGVHEFTVPTSIYKFLKNNDYLYIKRKQTSNAFLYSFYGLNPDSDFQNIRDISELRELKENEQMKEFKKKMRKYINKADILFDT